MDRRGRMARDLQPPVRNGLLSETLYSYREGILMSRIISRRSSWILAAALGFGAWVPLAGAADTVELKKVPQVARQQIEQASQNGSQVRVYDLGTVGSHKGVYMAHYTDAAGKRMEIKVGEDGAVLSQGETQGQRRKDAQAQLEGAKTDAERGSDSGPVADPARR